MSAPSVPSVPDDVLAVVRPLLAERVVRHAEAADHFARIETVDRLVRRFGRRGDVAVIDPPTDETGLAGIDACIEAMAALHAYLDTRRASLEPHSAFLPLQRGRARRRQEEAATRFRREIAAVQPQIRALATIAEDLADAELQRIEDALAANATRLRTALAKSVPVTEAGWESPGWQQETPPPGRPTRLRVGSLVDAVNGADLDVPVTIPLPERAGGPIVIDLAGSTGTDARALATSMAARLLAIGAIARVTTLDPAPAGLDLTALPTIGTRVRGEAVRAVLEDLDAITATAADHLLVVHSFPSAYRPREVELIRSLSSPNHPAGITTLIFLDDPAGDAEKAHLDAMSETVYVLGQQIDQPEADLGTTVSYDLAPPVEVASRIAPSAGTGAGEPATRERRAGRQGRTSTVTRLTVPDDETSTLLLVSGGTARTRRQLLGTLLAGLATHSPAGDVRAEVFSNALGDLLAHLGTTSRIGLVTAGLDHTAVLDRLDAASANEPGSGTGTGPTRTPERWIVIDEIDSISPISADLLRALRIASTPPSHGCTGVLVSASTPAALAPPAGKNGTSPRPTQPAQGSRTRTPTDGANRRSRLTGGSSRSAS